MDRRWRDGETDIVRTADGRDLAISQWGSTDGAPLIWLHGTPGSRLLRHVGDGYRRHSLRVITYDRPGYGLSTRLPGRQVVDAADDVRTIADALRIDQFGVAGVSGGGPPALAAAALLADRVTRCAAVVPLIPIPADGLDFFAGMDDEARTWCEAALAGGAVLDADGQETVDWVTSGMPDLDVPAHDRDMVIEAFDEAVRQGAGGYIDDRLSQVRGWGFSLGDLRAPTKIMVARDDTWVPPAHGHWLVSRLPDAELITVDGAHFGPRAEPEMDLVAWVGGGG